jgi:hypothetical protein
MCLLPTESSFQLKNVKFLEAIHLGLLPGHKSSFQLMNVKFLEATHLGLLPGNNSTQKIVTN